MKNQITFIDHRYGKIEIGDTVKFTILKAGGYWNGEGKGRVTGFTPTGRVKTTSRRTPNFHPCNLVELIKKENNAE